MPPAPLPARLRPHDPGAPSRILRISLRGEAWREPGPHTDNVSVYELDTVDLTAYQAYIFSIDCDQEELLLYRDAFNAALSEGRRALVNGHVALPYLHGLPRWRRSPYRGARDLEITPVHPHPVWAGITHADLLYRTGVPGTHTRETLEQIGVAGFYGRGFSDPLPPGAVIVNGLGPYQAAIDCEYRIGAGTVLIHNGQDLDAYVADTHPSAELGNALNAWLLAAPGYDAVSQIVDAHADETPESEPCT